MENEKGLITIAIGKKYVTQAKYLAWSCILNSPQMLRAVVTDCPKLLEPYFDIIIPFNRDFEDPFSVKTRLNLYTPFQKTLFLDADSLVMSNLDVYWESLKNCNIAYEGNMISEGEWYVDIKSLCKKLKVAAISKFNSGMILFNKSKEVNKVFDDAYYYFVNHKKEGIEIPYFRGTMYPDEPCFAIAYAKNKISPTNDFGRFSRTLINASEININVLKGFAVFKKNGRAVFPLVVHFCGKFGNIFYRREKARLYFCFNPPFKALFSYLAVSLRKTLRKKKINN